MRWPSIVGGAVIGIALMLVVSFAFGLSNSGTTDGGTWAALIAAGAFCYLVAGFVAGVWANWRGAGHGVAAGLMVWLTNLVYLFITGVAYGPGYESLMPLVFIGGIFALGIGALGGFIGGRIRR
jgi:hypothetical protein